MTTINFLKGIHMKTPTHFKRALLLSSFLVAGTVMAQAQGQVQAEGEPIKAPDEIPLLGGFEGCSVQPPKDNCNARIKCTGVGRIYGNSPFSIQDATKEAQVKARANLARFYSERVKAKDAVANAMESSGQSNASGGTDVKESFSRTMAEVTQTSAEAVLSGFQILGRQIDMNQRTVTVKGGVSCKSQAVAAQSQAASARSAAPSAGQAPAAPAAPQGPGSVSIGPTNIKSVNQKTKNADDF